MYRDKSAFKISANFKATMEDLKVMKRQASLTAVKVTLQTSVSATKDEKSIQSEKNIPDPYSTPVQGPTGSIFPKEEIIEKTHLAEEARKAGIKYIIFPKRKQKAKSGKYLSAELIQNIYVKLQDTPRILERLYYLNCFYMHLEW